MNSPTQIRPRTSTLVVLSGGQDSTTCAVMARQKFDEVHAVTFDYGQRHLREIQAACAVAKLLRCESHEVVSLGPILAGRSPLTNPDEVLEQYEDFQQMSKVIGNRVEKTFVPMRNALFLTLAANRAICKDIQSITTGVCEADNANYPDCRASFIGAQEYCIQEALAVMGFRIHAPLIDMSKAQSITELADMGELAILAFTHTAYDGQYPPIGNDHATLLRAQGFIEADLPDPLVLRAALIDNLMPLPETSNYREHPRLIDNLLVAIKNLSEELKA